VDEQPKCLCNQYKAYGICSHTGLVPQLRVPVNHSPRVPRAIERMHKRIRSNEEIKEQREQNGYKTGQAN
jgi:hypothetical protein